MKKILLSFALLLGSLLSFSQTSQDYCLGKTIHEIYSLNKEFRCYDWFKIRGMKTLHFIVSETVTDVYIFNEMDICVEYEHFEIHTNLETITSNLLSNFVYDGSSYKTYDHLYKAKIVELSSDAFGIIFSKTFF